ncbi:Flp pilus assembly protein CpaB [Cryobacterium tepidiphilum]|uniref:Flp pilus assembly protein CpaB n=1 Tax=Cryobacterium tepidiphilum TaxID=2486026 RepID=A0A3M8LBG9_9MICO|nr:Flp pilus assembly protein CpaB [Cryobacterium tepidiphilum]RNE62112.1 Flp pilus assembly protein CpaB [Cryobacterium tepidiphilum]
MKTRLIGAILAIVLALSGTVVLTGYVRGADARAAAGAELVPVFLVTAEIPAGTTAEQAQKSITAKKIQASAVAPGHVTKLSALAGKVAEVDLKPGEQLLSSRWVDPAARAAAGDVPLPVGKQAVTVALRVEQVVGGAVEPGDTVGVVISADKAPGAADNPLTAQALHKVLVTAVQEGETTAPVQDVKTPAEPASTIMVTLALTTPDIEKLVWGQEWGSVWLTLEPEDANEKGSRVVNGKVVFP